MKIVRLAEDSAELIIERLEQRGRFSIESVEDEVQKIIDNVRSLGDQAVLGYTKCFDGVDLEVDDLKVQEDEFKKAYASLRKGEIDAIRSAARNIRLHSTRQRVELGFQETEKGVKVAQILRPIGRVGIYAPGGKAIYPSSVLMTAIPAKVAGVRVIILCTPPSKDGKIASSILVAAREAGVDAVFKVGGAQAVAAMAYGTESIPKVDKIVGPGNIYVMAAKILVSRDVAIDNPAGPSEIMILADEAANPRFIAVDMIAQCEHGSDALAVLVTTSDTLARSVVEQMGQMKAVKRRKIVEKALEEGCWIFLASSVQEAVKLVNRLAPEHLEILVKEPTPLLDKVENAGAIFVGEYSPVAAGDYAVGSNHVLPVGGYARTYSGLSIRDFTKTIDVVSCTKDGLHRLEKTIRALADLEGLEMHGKSVSVRLEDEVR